MTGRYTSTSTSIYSDPDLRDWTALDIHFYRYLFGNDHVNGLTGIGLIDPRVMRIESRMTPKQIEQSKRKIGNRVRWFGDGTYWVVARAKHTCLSHDGTVNPKRAAGAFRFASQCHPDIAVAFIAHYRPIIGKGWPIYDPPMTHTPDTPVSVPVLMPVPVPVPVDVPESPQGSGDDFSDVPPPEDDPPQNGQAKRIAHAADVWWNRAPMVSRRMTIGDTLEAFKGLVADGWAVETLERFSTDGPVSCVASSGIFAINAKKWKEEQPAEKPKARKFHWVNNGTEQAPKMERVFDE